MSLEVNLRTAISGQSHVFRLEAEDLFAILALAVRANILEGFLPGDVRLAMNMVCSTSCPC